MAKLDFIIFGPGRSGTTALALAFNLHPEIFCAIEFFGLRDGVDLAMPDAMMRPQRKERAKHQTARDALTAKLQRGPLRFYGNKFPNYYFRLAEMVRHHPALKAFFIYRSPRHFVHSWDARAARADDRWPDGRRGVFGVLEQIFCLKRLAGLDTAAVMLAYDALFYTEPTAVRRAVETLGADGGRFDQATFEARFFSRVPRKSMRSDAYDALFDIFRFDVIDGYFEKNSLALSDAQDFRSAVQQQFASLPQPQELVEWLRRFDPPALEYVQRWEKYVRNRLDDADDEASRWVESYARQTRVAALGR